MATHITSMVSEMESFLTVSTETKEKAKLSKITDSNNKDFKILMRDWIDGIYDDDPQTVLDELESMLNK